MRLAPMPYSDPNDRALLKPKIGDMVLFEGTKYVVDQIGLKYASLHLDEDPHIKGMAKLNQISKWFPNDDDEDEAPPMNLINQGGNDGPLLH